ncbi:MAG: hypothetical protein C4547_15395 [Phycisphaerales bacterium]|nr:MAG: hypothetical protein C4547_15395 [Phycisphaerales bacterium]
MRNNTAFVSAAMLCLCITPAAMSQAVWGGFDATRINYGSGTLDGSAHAGLRAVIAENDGVVGAMTAELTDDYLSGVDVFYTSLLSRSTGVLSQPEQEALGRFIGRGGTLIVTADIFPLEAYESSTAQFGVTGYRALTGVGVGRPVAQHVITENVVGYAYNTESTYNYGKDALLLGDNGRGSDYMIVMEPETGFNAGGRIVVVGDHNMFTDTYLNQQSNRILAGNIAAWGAEGGNRCTYTLKKSKPKGGCGNCPPKGGEYRTQTACEDVKDCDKKVKTIIACPNGGNGTCKLKGKRDSCG